MHELRHLRQGLPPQCIWIVRGKNPQTGRPVPEPDAFYIDIDICMNCGYCAEFCPFDAIKMDHDYELASYDRTSAHIYDKQKLSKEVSYWKRIAPTTAQEEMEVRVWLGTQGCAEGKGQGRARLRTRAQASLPQLGLDNRSSMSDRSEAVRQALATVIEPELNQDIISLDMVKDLQVDGPVARFTIVLIRPPAR